MGRSAVGQTRADGATAFEDFIRQNLQRIFLQIYRMVRSVDDAQDLTQDAEAGVFQGQ